MTCPNNNFSSNRPPTGNDDPCNTSNQGVFSEGSYWLYDPTLPGADTATHGDCARLYLNTGGACTVAEWTELQLSSPRFENVDPTAADCCPAGTVWVNEAATPNNVFVSYADLSVDPPVCNWCQICGANQNEFFIAEQFDSFATVAIPTPIAAAGPFVEAEAPIVQNFTNPTNFDMHCMIGITGLQANAFNAGLAGDDINIQLQFSDDGVTWNSIASLDKTMRLDAPGTNGDFQENGTSGFNTILVIPAGGTDEIHFRRVFRSNTGYNGLLFFDGHFVHSQCIVLPV